MIATEGTELWRPSPERAQASELARYMRWLADERGLRFDDYRALHAWSVQQIQDFWASTWSTWAAPRTSRCSWCCEKATRSTTR